MLVQTGIPCSAVGEKKIHTQKNPLSFLFSFFFFSAPLHHLTLQPQYRCLLLCSYQHPSLLPSFPHSHSQTPTHSSRCNVTLGLLTFPSWPLKLSRLFCLEKGCHRGRVRRQEVRDGGWRRARWNMNKQASERHAQHTSTYILDLSLSLSPDS